MSRVSRLVYNSVWKMIINKESFARSRLQELVAGLQAAGFRLTPQRIAICRALAENSSHPTARILFKTLRKQYPGISLATIYKTVNTLREIGLIDTVGHANDGAQHFEANPEPHLNLICLRCHRIVDFWDVPVSRWQKQAEIVSGFQLTGARLAFYGLCPNCLKREAKRKR